jgi:hypothetical protein
VYQRYSRTAADPGYQREREDALALWRPLFMTSFGAADFLVESGRVEGGAIVISSASSKTALGTAFVLSRDRSSEYELIALTSPHNLAFCERVGYYDRVLAYDDLHSLRRDAPATFVDFAGDESLLPRLRAHLGESLRSTTIIGATHWEERAPGRPLAAPDTTFFFLPPWLEKRRSDWGRGEFARRYGDVWRAFLASTESWLTIARSEGPDAVEAVYRELLDGRARPDVGHILSLSS